MTAAPGDDRGGAPRAAGRGRRADAASCAGTAARRRAASAARGSRCRSTAPARCPGTVAAARRAREPRLGQARDALMYLSGGPGGAGVLEMVDVLLDRPAADRATSTCSASTSAGRGAAGCCAARRSSAIRGCGRRAAGEACARQLGAAAALLHDARQRRGHGGDPEGGSACEKLTLFGISYGTELALAYARAHPDRVDAADPRLDRRPGRRRPVRARRLPRDDADAARAVPGRVRRAHARPRRRPDRARRRGCGAPRCAAAGTPRTASAGAER